MNTFTIKLNSQTLTLSSDDALALEAALIQARKSPNQDIQQMTNSGIMLVTCKSDSAAKFSRPIKPSDYTLSEPTKPFYSQSEVVETDC